MKQKFHFTLFSFLAVAFFVGFAASRSMCAPAATPTTALTAPAPATASTAATAATGTVPLLREVPSPAIPSLSEKEKATAHRMSTLQALALGVTEGLTEYIPVSSTGHLYLVARALGIYKNDKDKEAADAYEICIQFGAILAVLVLFLSRFVSMINGVLGKDKAGKRLAINVVAAFIPAAVMGLLFEKHIKQVLFGLWPITAAWLVGGIVILIVSKKKFSLSKKEHQLAELSPKQALLIGLMQCFSLWPGVSRSLVTILGGTFIGLELSAAVEFSFLLGFVTLGAATCYEFLKQGSLIFHTFGVFAPLLGVVVSFISAAAAVKWLVSYLNSHSLSIFGYYRIILAIVVAVLIIVHVL